MTKRKVAYLMSRFPHLPETFILREMEELADQGWNLALYPLIYQNQTLIHEEAKRWIEKAVNTPFFSFPIFVAILKFLFKDLREFIFILVSILQENKKNPRFLVRSLAFFPKTIYLASLMKKDNIQHIHAHYATYPALAAWIIHRLTKIPYSVTVHAHDIFESKAMLATKLKDARFIIAISKYNRDYLIENLGAWIAEKIHVVHCGIRTDYYSQRLPDRLPEEYFRVIHIGSLESYKGQKILIQACDILKRSHIPIHLQIIGMGIEKRNLEGMISYYQLTDHVELLGPKTQEEIARILPTGHCYVQPSIITKQGTMEGIPVSMMEAMACGLPVIASAISGIPELIKDGYSGYLIPPADPVALAEAFKRVYQNYSEAVQFAENGREKVMKEFDLQKNVAEISELFQTQF